MLLSVYAEFDFAIHYPAVFSSESLEIHSRRVGAYFIAFANGPPRGNPLRVIDCKASFVHKKLLKEFANLLWHCFFFGKSNLMMFVSL